MGVLIEDCAASQRDFNRLKRNGQRGVSWSSAKATTKPCSWRWTTPGTRTGGGITSRKAALQERSWGLGDCVNNIYILAFFTTVCIMQQENIRFTYFHILQSKPHMQGEGCSRWLPVLVHQIPANCSDAYLCLSLLPFSGWEAPRSSVVPRACLLLSFTSFLSPWENGNSLQDTTTICI